MTTNLPRSREFRGDFVIKGHPNQAVPHLFGNCASIGRSKVHTPELIYKDENARFYVCRDCRRKLLGMALDVALAMDTGADELLLLKWLDLREV